MNAMIAAMIMGICIAATPAWAQCSSWGNATNIVQVVGNDVPIIDAPLSNNAEFVFLGDAASGLLAFTIDNDGVKEFKSGWVEDENGTAVLTDDFGHICTITCDAAGGIGVLIEEVNQATFTPAQFEVTSEGFVSTNPAPIACPCSVFSSATPGVRNQVVCTPSACKNRIFCRSLATSAGTVQTGACTPTSSDNPGGGS